MWRLSTSVGDLQDVGGDTSRCGIVHLFAGAPVEVFDVTVIAGNMLARRKGKASSRASQSDAVG